MVCEITPHEGKDEANACLIAASPALWEACQMAAKLVETARQYFPKSIYNPDRFSLETTCAAIGKALYQAEGRQSLPHIEPLTMPLAKVEGKA